MTQSRRRARLLAGLLLLAILALLARRLAEQGLEIASKWATPIGLVSNIVAAGSAAGAAWVSWAQWREAKARRLDPALQPGAVSAIVDDLVAELTGKYRAMVRQHRVHAPIPLPVRFSPASEVIQDHVVNIMAGAGPRALPTLRGQIKDLAREYLELPSRRLVIIGRPGSGKTVMVVQFSVDLLRQRANDPSLPIPVILYPGDWDSLRLPLNTWLARQLEQELPTLCSKHLDGRSLAEHLIVDQRVLPILDGLDEMAELLQERALHRLNHTLVQGDRLLLTCRVDEYVKAISAGDVLTAGAVVEIQDLTTQEVAAYLRRTTKPGGRGHGETKWDSVLRRLLDGADQSVAARNLRSVLSSPLMVSLARTIYSEGSVDPNGLMDIGAFPDRVAIENHLLDNLAPAVFGERELSRRRFTLGGGWRPDRAQRYLDFLAASLFGARDVAWWHLARQVPRRTAAVALFLAGASLGGSVGAWRLGFIQAWQLGLTLNTRGWAVLALSALVPGLLSAYFGVRGGFEATPHTSIQIRGRWGAALELFGVCMSIGIASNALWSLVTGALPSSLQEVLDLLTWTAGVAVIVTLMFGFFGPIDMRRSASPMKVLTSERLGALVRGACAGIGVLLLDAATSPRTDLDDVAYSALIGTWFILSSAWFGLAVARVWAWSNGRLPWRLMAFLAEASTLGVLRQSGGFYQFRHPLLQARHQLRGQGLVSAPTDSITRIRSDNRYWVWSTLSLLAWGICRRLPRVAGGPGLHADYHYADALVQLGRYIEADPVWRHIRASAQALDDDEQWRMVDFNLASNLERLQRWKEARELIEDLLAWRQTSLGDLHPRTLNAASLLGNILLGQELLAEAESLLRHVIEIRTRLFGATHSTTLADRHDLARVLARGDRCRAEAMLREILLDARQAGAERNSEMLLAKRSLALVIAADPLRTAEVDGILASALRGLKRHLGSHHPETLVTCLERVKAQVICGKRPAKPTFALPELAEGLERTVGLGHASTVEAHAMLRDPNAGISRLP